MKLIWGLNYLLQQQNFAWICKQHQDLIGSVLIFRTKIWSGILWISKRSNIYTCYIQSLKILACFCGCAGRFVSYLVANPEDRFSRDEAHIICKNSNYILMLVYTQVTSFFQADNDVTICIYYLMYCHLRQVNLLKKETDRLRSS